MRIGNSLTKIGLTSVEPVRNLENFLKNMAAMYEISLTPVPLEFSPPISPIPVLPKDDFIVDLNVLDQAREGIQFLIDHWKKMLKGGPKDKVGQSGIAVH